MRSLVTSIEYGFELRDLLELDPTGSLKLSLNFHLKRRIGRMASSSPINDGLMKRLPINYARNSILKVIFGGILFAGLIGLTFPPDDLPYVKVAMIGNSMMYVHC